MIAEPNVGGAPRPDAGPLHTEVELTWLEGRIEHWLRFGRDCGETILDRRRRCQFELAHLPTGLLAQDGEQADGDGHTSRPPVT